VRLSRGEEAARCADDQTSTGRTPRRSSVRPNQIDPRAHAIQGGRRARISSSSPRSSLLPLPVLPACYRPNPNLAAGIPDPCPLTGRLHVTPFTWSFPVVFGQLTPRAAATWRPDQAAIPKAGRRLRWRWRWRCRSTPDGRAEWRGCPGPQRTDRTGPDRHRQASSMANCHWSRRAARSSHDATKRRSCSLTPDGGPGPSRCHPTDSGN